MINNQPMKNLTSQGKEFYSGDFYSGYFDNRECAYNERIYYTGNSDSGKSYVVSSDYDGNDIRIEFEITDDYLRNFIFVNNFGVYLYNIENYNRFQIIHYDFDGRALGEYKEAYDDSYENDHILKCVYIVNNICYFAHVFSNSAEIKRVNMDEGGSVEIIYKKASSIERLFATDKILIFKARYYNADVDESAYGWMLMHLETGEVESLSNPFCSPETVLEHPEIYDSDSDSYDEKVSYDIDIAYFDLNRNIFWTCRQAKEGDDSAQLHMVYYLEPHYLEGDRTKIINSYPVWKFPKEPGGTREYFDGEHHYYAEKYEVFKSSDQYGNVFVWSEGNGGHGNCWGFRVLGNHLFLDVDARDEKEYDLTFEPCEPIRKSWFRQTLSPEAIERFESGKD